MRNSMRGYVAALLTGAALAGLAQPAFAQTAPAPAPPPAPADATPQTSGNVDDGGIAEIVVTAQKRSQNLQNVPIAVSAIDSNTLKAKGITDTSDLMGALPSLQITTPYGKT